MSDKDYFIAELKRIGATKVVIEYSGSGDSGQVDSIDAYVKQNKERHDVDEMYDLVTSTEDVIPMRVSEALLNQPSQSLSNRLEQFAYELLDSVGASDWCNNEGGQGTMTICVEADDDTGSDAGTIDIEHGVNITQVEHEHYTA